MEEPENMMNFSVSWRGNKYAVELDSNASLKDLGDELQKMTGVKSDTMRLIVPQSSGKGSKLLSPFTDDHSGLSLHEASIAEGKSLRMMGVSEDEVDKILQSAKVDMRIAGFEEEENRMKRRISGGPRSLFKLPQGPYIFCNFQTLEIPGIELHPPASEALKRMHMLASDPGIVAIMNKHCWRVGIMTEMAPVGYVGVSPKCILGLNKNHGEEISLRLRTDDLKGFRKYASIKRTLLHELAHMVYSEHDANFYALDKQLNEEANQLDWTKSKGQPLGRASQLNNLEEEYDDTDNRSFSQKLGGNASNQLASARESSIAAAYHRICHASNRSEVLEEPDPDDSCSNKQGKPDSMDAMINSMETEVQINNQLDADHEPDPDENCDFDEHEPDPDDSQSVQWTKTLDTNIPKIVDEPDPDDKLDEKNIEVLVHLHKYYVEPDPDETTQSKVEPDPDESHQNKVEPDPDGCLRNDDTGVVQAKPESCQISVSSQTVSCMQIDEPDPDDGELQRIQDPVTSICHRLQKAMEMLRAEVNSTDVAGVLQTLLKIIRNVMEHPNKVKYKRLRKANPIIQRNVVNYRAAMEILQMIGFSEDVISDEIGKSDTYLVFQRNDPGLLWLAKSSLEAYAS